MPTSAGVIGQVLTTDGTGVLAWTNPGGGGAFIANATSNLTIISNATTPTNSYMNFNIASNLVANVTNVGISVNGIMSANTVSATSLTSNGNIIVSGTGNSSITSTAANINLYANTAQVQIGGNLAMVANASLNKGYIMGAIVARQLPNSYIPPTNSSAGVVGTITYDSTYMYLCVGLNTWARFTLNTTW
jgi:hypothetical protein